MKSLILIAVLASSTVFARPHLDLEMTSKEYLHHLSKMPKKSNKNKFNSEDLQIERFLAIGKRNLQWVDFVNSTRSPENRLSLSSPATQAGNPVSNPRTYNFRIIKDKWDILIALLPKPLKKVVIEGAPFTADIGVTDREFIEWLFQVDSAYQIAARYKMMLPWKEEMKQGVAQDVRGYVNLITEENLDEKLQNWEALPEMTKTRFTRDLGMICLNSGKDRASCSQELSEAIQNSSLVIFKSNYLANGKAVYDAFFNILGSRPDGVWTSADPNTLTFPFANPKNDTILDFLKVNIEEEWQWNGWKLILNFVESEDPNMTHIVFEEGATPHVESAPGSIITMDANTPLSEYDVQWTIRHEYGHVIGFPDCYHEFYDEAQEAFVSYQLDVTNLMCSRRGKLLETHYDELKKAYFRP